MTHDDSRIRTIPEMVAYHTDATKLAIEAYAAGLQLGLRAAAEVCDCIRGDVDYGQVVDVTRKEIKRRIEELAAHPEQITGNE